MKKLMLFVVLAGMVFALYAQNAESIVRDSRNRIKAETVSTRSRAVSKAKDGTVTKWVFDQHSKDGPNGKRTMIEFKSPHLFEGNRILAMEKPGSEDDCRIKFNFTNRVLRMVPTVIFIDKPINDIRFIEKEKKYEKVL